MSGLALATTLSISLFMFSIGNQRHAGLVTRATPDTKERLVGGFGVCPDLPLNPGDKHIKKTPLFSLLLVIFLWPGGRPVATAQEPDPSWALSDEVTFENQEQIQGLSTKGT